MPPCSKRARHLMLWTRYEEYSLSLNASPSHLLPLRLPSLPKTHARAHTHLYLSVSHLYLYLSRACARPRALALALSRSLSFSHSHTPTLSLSCWILWTRLVHRHICAHAIVETLHAKRRWLRQAPLRMSATSSATMRRRTAPAIYAVRILKIILH